MELLAGARENLFDVLARLCAGLETLVDAILASELNSSVELDLTLALELALVSDEVDANVLGRMLPNLLQPRLKIFESLVTRDIISQEDAMRTAVKNPRHRLE